MDCCYLAPDECDAYSVTPVLVVPNHIPRYCEEVPKCCPQLPSCQKPLMYCYEQKPEKVVCCNENKPKVIYCTEKKPEKIMYCYEKKPQKVVYRCGKKSQGECCTSSSKYHEPQQSQLNSSNDCELNCKPVKTKYIIPCYRYEDGRIERYVPTRFGRLPTSAYRRNGIQDQMHGYRGAIRYLCANHHPYYGNCVHTAVEPMRKCYPKITQEVRELPVTAFKRNGLQDQQHSKTLGTANFLVRCSRDVAIEFNECPKNIKVADPAKVPLCRSKLPDCIRSKPIKKNQPTLLMHRACEVACGERPRRKPFVVSSYHADPDHEVRRFHLEDDKGNCCFHFERNKSESCVPPEHRCVPIGSYVSSPSCEYVECTTTDPCVASPCCYYCN